MLADEVQDFSGTTPHLDRWSTGERGIRFAAGKGSVRTGREPLPILSKVHGYSAAVEVLRLTGEGKRTKEIAFDLGITFKTAVTHRSNIMEKLGVHEGPRLVRFAIRTGIVEA